MKVSIFAHRGAVTAIAFPGEPTNYNGSVVLEIDTEPDAVAEALAAAGVGGGVGSPWPPVSAEAAKAAPKVKK